MLYLFIVLGIIEILTVIVVYAFAAMGTINIDAVYQQIYKLIMANNIDRAIKLCNSVSHPATRHFKAMLCHTGRPWLVELARQESLMESNLKLKVYGKVFSIETLVAFGIFALMAFVIVSVYPTWWAVLFLMIVFTCRVLLIGVRLKFIKYSDEIEFYGVKIRNLILANKSENFIPMALKEVSDEEFAEWKESVLRIDNEADYCYDNDIEYDVVEEYKKRIK